MNTKLRGEKFKFCGRFLKLMQDEAWRNAWLKINNKINNYILYMVQGGGDRCIGELSWQ